MLGYLRGLVPREAEPPAAIGIPERIDRQAMERIFDRYRRPMWRVAHRIVGPTDADDVVQRTQLAVYRAQSIDPDRPWPFLLVSTRNEARAYRRSKHRRREEPLTVTTTPTTSEDSHERTRLFCLTWSQVDR
jgi:DNA-directed RNA polymerase specialized sigma24 family protein